MPQSLSNVIIHIIFSTKDREPWLDRDVRPRMHAYVATICWDQSAEPFLVGGVADHLHVVTTLPRTLSSRFQRSLLKDECCPGALPQALDERAPLALNAEAEMNRRRRD